MVLKKIKRNGEFVWAIVSKKTGRPLQYFGNKKPPKEQYESVEKRIKMFKHMNRKWVTRGDGVKQRYWVNMGGFKIGNINIGKKPTEYVPYDELRKKAKEIEVNDNVENKMGYGRVTKLSGKKIAGSIFTLDAVAPTFGLGTVASIYAAKNIKDITIPRTDEHDNKIPLHRLDKILPQAYIQSKSKRRVV